MAKSHALERRGPAENGVPRLTPIRCACRACGTHVIVDAGFFVGGYCTNCASYDLVLVGEELRAQCPVDNSAFDERARISATKTRAAADRIVDAFR